MHFANLEAFDVERVWQDALRILSDVGLQFANEAIRRSRSSALSLRGERVHLDAPAVEHFADEIRTRFGQPTSPAAAREVTLHNSPLNCFWLDPADGQIKPHDTQAVIRNTKLTCQLTAEGALRGTVAGVPQDVPGEMQFLMAHYVDCVYNPRAHPWGVIHTEPMLRYFLEMADIMGFTPGIGSEMISPLKFMGESIDLSLQYGREGVRVGVDPMPILGVTAPLDWHAAWAQSVAENLGSYAVFRECGAENVCAPSFRLFVPNIASGATCFSAPQHVAALLSRRQVRRFFELPTESAELLLVTAKAPDQQAAIEKTVGCVVGRTHGFHVLEGAGGLWLDEIFSPQQLMIDVEIKRFVDAMTADFAEPPVDLVALMNQGVKAGSFLAHDLTLDRFHEFSWQPRLFDLRPRAAWGGDPTVLLKRAAGLAAEKAALHTYELADSRRDQLERVMERARKELGGPRLPS